MILPIYVYGQQVLRKEAEDIANDYPNIQDTIQNMFDTLDNSGGVGLAAPQVGLPIRIVVIDLDVISEDKPEYKGFRKAYINGHIEEYGPEQDSCEEGCLSIPGIYETVKRPTSIRVRYLNEQLEPQDEWVSGYLARVIQHEFDHLDGQLFVDHLTGLRKQLIKNKLTKVQRGQVNTSYRTKPNR